MIGELLKGMVDEFNSMSNPESEMRNKQILSGTYNLAAGTPANIALMAAAVSVPTLDI